MNTYNHEAKELVDLAWEDENKKFYHEFSGWDERKPSLKSKSLEFSKTYNLRPKLMIPRVTKLRKRYSPSIVPSVPLPQVQVSNERKIESLIIKLIEKNKKKSDAKKILSFNRFGKKIVTRIPFLDYKLNLPRSLNTINTSRTLKPKYKTTIDRDNFTYKLKGISLLKKYN